MSSVDSSANANCLTITTGWASTDQLLIACTLRANALGSFQSVWDHGDNGPNYTPQLFFDPSQGTNALVVTTVGTQQAITQPDKQMMIDAAPTAGLWYDVVTILSGTAVAPVSFYRTNGGGVVRVLQNSVFSGLTGTVLTIFDELAQDQTSNGQIREFVIGRSTTMPFTQQHAEYLLRKPLGEIPNIPNLWGYYPLDRHQQPGIERSGKSGRNLTVTGAALTTRINTPPREPSVPRRVSGGFPVG